VDHFAEELLDGLEPTLSVRSSSQGSRRLVASGITEPGVLGCGLREQLVDFRVNGGLFCMEAGAAIFVPSRATRPALAMPALWQSRIGTQNTSLSAASCPSPKRAIVVWTGVCLTATTRRATSTWQARSICRELRTPRH